jgi:arsenate reductase
MTKANIVAALAALAQETRLDILRLLIERGSEGMPAGEIGDRLKLPSPTLSFHLNQLRHARLVDSQRHSRLIIYNPKFHTMKDLLDYLSDNCCADRPLKTAPLLPHRVPAPKYQYNVLFLCTRNSARSIMAECAMNRWGEGRFRAFSAGSNPRGEVHPITVQVLKQLGYGTDVLSSKNWNEFAQPGSRKLDFVFTLCDRAAAETCPAWPGQPVRAHWGVEDPVAVSRGAAKRKAFEKAYIEVEQRIRIFAALPVEILERFALEHWVNEIGKLRLAA